MLYTFIYIFKGTSYLVSYHVSATNHYKNSNECIIIVIICVGNTYDKKKKMIFILVVENKIYVIICIADMIKQIFTSVLENTICSKFKKPVPSSNEFNTEKG